MRVSLNRLSLLVAFAGLFALSTASAGGDSHDNAIPVSYQDLNLSNDADIGILYGRVKFAAYQVCGDRDMRVSLYVIRDRRACVKSAVNKAIREINEPRLSALHEEVLLEARQS